MNIYLYSYDLCFSVLYNTHFWSESGSAFSAAPAGDAVDFSLPVDWKNLLKTACLADAGLEEAGFRRDIARPGVNSPRAGPSRERGPAAAVPGASAGASTS